jgi:hypothetical protein
MCVGRIREAIAQLIADLLKYVVRCRDSKRDYKNREGEELAQSVLDYGRMRLHLSAQQAVLVEVDELAFRLRETRRAITKVLYLLESQRRAKRTELEGLWSLQFELQHSRNRRSEGESTSSDHALLPTNGRTSS